MILPQSQQPNDAAGRAHVLAGRRVPTPDLDRQSDRQTDMHACIHTCIHTFMHACMHACNFIYVWNINILGAGRGNIFIVWKRQRAANKGSVVQATGITRENMRNCKRIYRFVFKYMHVCGETHRERMVSSLHVIGNTSHDPARAIDDG
jgi:hypothetical protein